MVIPQGALTILETLERAGEEAFVVGGCVRDTLLGKTPGDWDICTSASPEAIMQIFAHYHVIPTGLQHGTITVRLSDGAYEVTTYRVDGEYEDHRRPKEVTFTKNLSDDLARRDFTINAMAYHPHKGLVDLYGGQDDLKTRCIRAVGDPYERFEEDGLRILRMVRFATSLDFDYDAHTYQAAMAKAPLMQYVSAERIRVEFEKILCSTHVTTGLEALQELNLYPYIAPEICHLIGYEQRSPQHFLDVFEHTLLSVGLIDKDPILRLTMFLHDIGKPFAQEGETKDRFPKHEIIGAKIADDVLRRLKYDNYTRKEVVALVRAHTDGIEPTAYSVRCALARHGKERLLRLLSVKVADILAHRITYHERNSVLNLFDTMRSLVYAVESKGEAYHVKMLALTGGDLVQLGYRNEAVGRAQRALLQHVLQYPEDNTKERLEMVLARIGKEIH